MGIDRIRTAFCPERASFMPYLMLGYPTRNGSLEVARVLAECGADLLELGVPFSDPLADGVVNQAAAQQALENGMTLAGCLEQVSALRAGGLNTPALLMSYVNPILAYGVERCAAQAAQVGVDGFIIPDLPPEEAGEVVDACREHRLGLVFLLAPNSPPERIQLAVEQSRGFLYLVSLTGVTGVRERLPQGLEEFIGRVRRSTSQPLAVGFGISSAAQAAAVARLADGVIVGSALVRRSGESLARLRDLAFELSQAVHAARGRDLPRLQVA